MDEATRDDGAGRSRGRFRLAWVLVPPIGLALALMMLDRHTTLFTRPGAR